MDRTQKSPIVYLDTHIAVWLYDGLVENLSLPAKEMIESGNLFLPAMTFLELAYLHEIGRFSSTPERTFKVLEKELAIKRSEYSFFDIARIATNFKWSRDPFNRLIVAEATLAKGYLISKDRTIRTHFAHTVW